VSETLDEQARIRREKRERLRGAGVEVYPHRFALDLEPAAVQREYGGRSREELAEGDPVRLRVAGRVRGMREHGKSVFVDLYEGGAKLQLLVRADRLQGESKLVLEHLDLGDQLGASGALIRTRTGELTLEVDGLTMLAKALRPLPEKWHGLADVEARYRQRYLDLIVNPESRGVFETRARLVSGIRRFLDARGFLEVETPMMQIIPTGAVARPFRTHHNALDLDLYLRIAPELFLKRLVVGGLHRVYEINRNFRNEGISTQHNPEFTMLEFYWAFADYRSLMDFTEEMMVTLAREVTGGTVLTWRGATIDLTPPWRRVTMREAAGPAAAELSGLALVEAFERVEDTLLQPTFVHDYPVEVSPLAKPRADEPRMSERFELYIGGMEIANAFTELNDPDTQALRFREQAAARAKGDDEAHWYDEEYIRALEYGLPPTGGEGVGIDRLAMLFCDRPSIRDVILFPLLRPAAEPAS
jgi:lysyl-tRNA synthetase class 2